MTQQTIGRLNQQASVRRFQMDDVSFTFVADGAMSMAPQMLLKAIPPAYWSVRMAVRPYPRRRIARPCRAVCAMASSFAPGDQTLMGGLS